MEAYFYRLASAFLLAFPFATSLVLQAKGKGAVPFELGDFVWFAGAWIAAAIFAHAAASSRA